MTIYPSGSIINNRYEVVQGPHEKPTLAGGMGLVYLCVDHGEDGRPVALKTFRSEYLPNREARDRFLREGTTWVELGKHPYIVRCYEVIKGTVGSEVFLVLELIAAAEGKSDASLRSWLTSGNPLPVEQALIFSLHLAWGMKHATEKIPGLVHRDLKPENVLVGRDGMARITDFGLASAMQEAGGKLQVASDKESDDAKLGRTQLTRGIIGTPLYMAPEQWAGAELDARSDIYAYGCILYEMLVGKRAVAGKTVAEIEKAHRNGQVDKVLSTLSNHLGHLLQRCVKVDREERYSNWLELESEVAGVWKAVMGKEAPPAAPDSLPDLPGERVGAGWSYIDMGLSYRDIAKPLVAKGYFEKARDVAAQENDRALEGAALGNIGTAYLEMGDAKDAIQYLERHLAIAREIGDHYGEGNALGNLGLAYADLGDLGKAISYQEQRLYTTRRIGDRLGESQSLGNLGNVYRQLGDLKKAIAYQQERLPISREIGDRFGEGQTLGNLGNAYRELGDVKRASEYQLQRLAIAREIGDHRGEGNALGNLGGAYLDLGDINRAIEFLNQHVAIAREIGDRQGEGTTLGNLGKAYSLLGDNRQAILFFEQDQKIAQEIGDRRGLAIAKLNIAILLAKQGELMIAQKNAREAYKTLSEIGNTAHTQLAQKLLDRIKAQLG